MTAAELERLEYLLDELLALDAGERQRRVRALCEGPDPIAPVVARLITQHERASHELAPPPDDGRVPPGFDPLLDPLIGRTLGDFKILRLIGAGAVGRVYEARQLSPDRGVALKVLGAHALATDGTSLRRFQREADLLGALDHPGICRVYAAGSAPIGGEVVPYIAMELVAGVPLDVAVADLPPPALVELFARIADAAHAAHVRGVVHRDLKPANVLVIGLSGTPVDKTAQPNCKILDFGVSSFLSTGAQLPSLRTQTGQLMGTLAYMSPEQLAARPADARSDVYAIGVMLFERLTGRRPIVGGRPGALALRPQGAGGLDKESLADLEAVMARALEPEPGSRYQTAAELSEDLRRVLSRRPVSARQGTLLYRASRFVRRRRREVGLAFLALLCLVVACVLIVAAVAKAGEARSTADELQRARSLEEYTGRLQQAEAEMRASNFSAAAATLESIDERHRGWEWHYLNQVWPKGQAALQDGTVPQGSLRVFNALRHPLTDLYMYYPLGALARMVRDAEGMVDFDLVSFEDPARVLLSIPDLPTNAWRFNVTPDARYAVLVGVGKSGMRVYDGKTAELLHESPLNLEHEDNYLAMHPDGSQFALAGASGTARFFSIPDLEPMGEIHAGGRIEGMHFSPTGDRIVIAYWTDKMAVFSTDDKSRLVDMQETADMPVYPFFSDDGNRIAALKWVDTNLSLWDAHTGRLLRRQPMPELPQSFVAIPGANRVAVGCYDSSVRLFAFDVPETGLWIPTLVLRETEGVPFVLNASRDGRSLVAAIDNGEILIWSLQPAEVPGTN